MKKYSPLTITLVVLGIFLITLLLRQIPALQSLELKTIDWRFSRRGPLSVKDSPIVLVTIDDQSSESLPDRWPWPRQYFAHVIENLNRAGAKVIGLDVILDVPDKYGPASDSTLAETLRRWDNVVLTGKLEERHTPGRVQSYLFPVTPIPLFLEAGVSWGTTAIQADADGIYRRYFVIQKFTDGWLPSFGLEVLRKYFRLGDNLKPQIQDHTLHFGKLTVPLQDDQLMMINFAGPAGTFPSYSFDSVIDDESFALKDDYDLDYFSSELLPAGIFKDKIVLIGSTVSEHHDNFPTPFFEYPDPNGQIRKVEMPGVEIHANAIWTILTRRFIHQVSFGYVLIIVLGLILLIYLSTLRLPVAWGIVLSLAVLLGFNLLSFWLFSHQQVLMEMVAPTLAIFLSFVGSNLHQYVITQREKRIITSVFERYVPKKVIKELLDHPDKVQLGGEERVITVMFTDLESFTSVSENLSPRELVNLINLYLTEMTDIILKYDGIIDKYEGDAIMAEFGAPVYYETHALNACYAALEMQERIKKLNLKKFQAVVRELNCRIGINSGPMIVGNMGSRDVFDYTVMGDAVNLAARLETANKIYRTKIMISEDTYHMVKNQIVVRPLDLLRVKGKKKPVRVFEVVGRKDRPLPEALQAMLPVFVTGLKYYHQREWENARSCFEFCLSKIPGDGPSRLYLERIAEYQKNPPPDDWDGVFTMQTK